jgi:peptide-methionine (S)-S-oxide reductase
MNNNNVTDNNDNNNNNNSNKAETATLANGCFWCSEAIFKRLKGVKSVMPGYAGGSVKNPSYNQVCSGETGHAESVQIEFDPRVIPFENILNVFWHTHNPTTLNRQGNDIGTQYRSAIFYHDERQREIAEKSKKRFEKEGLYKANVVTEITPFRDFYVAEDYHKDYYDRYPTASYCNFVIEPKIRKLREQYGSEIKEQLT